MKNSWSSGGTILVRVGPHHFAFLRGYFEGLALPTLSRRYLETAISPDPDLRIAKSTLKWIREQLMIAARRKGMFAEARLILLDPEKLRNPEKRTMPSLEEFREIRDPHELFSETELIELFQEEYGNNAHSDRRTTRNERLRRKQFAALLALEKLLVIPPSPSDDIAGWLHPVLASRLKNAGLATLGELVTTINERGYRWWTRVPRFGEKAAAQVIAWLQTESTTNGLGIRLGTHAVTKASKIPRDTLANERVRGFGIVPLEYLHVPPHLDGTDETKRSGNCSISAQNDLEAVNQWLASKEKGSNTWRSYRKEAERLLLWTLLERGKSLSVLSSEDCRDYLRFLAELGEDGPWNFHTSRADWIAHRGTKRWSTLWRPFEGGLSAESRQLAATILALMGRWFVDCGYWNENPWSSITKDRPARPVTQRKKCFSEKEWTVLWSFLESGLDGLRASRLRFIVTLHRETEIRLSELTAARRDDIYLLDGEMKDGGVMKIRAGARSGTELPVTAVALRELDTYLSHRGLGGLLACPPSAPLVGRIPHDSRLPDNSQGLSANGLSFVLKEFFADVAAALDNGTLQEMAKQFGVDTSVFREAEISWLRS